MNTPTFSVLMIGPRRVGKSSVLASMTNSINSICDKTGYSFVPDNDSEQMFNKKLDGLKSIFTKHSYGEVFSTSDDVERNMQDDHYFFELKQRNEVRAKIAFTDIEGEAMYNRLLYDDSDGKMSVAKLAAGSSVIIIAIDTPSLMYEGQQSLCEGVNQPDETSNAIINADQLILEEGHSEIPPRMILFIPLRCEKWYYEKQMDAVNEKIKFKYSRLIDYASMEDNNLKNKLTLAITPILTLGDVIFDGYPLKDVIINGSKFQRIETVRVGTTLAPKEVNFTFRNHTPEFDPQFCEQPMIYLMSFINAMSSNLSQTDGNSTAVSSLERVIKSILYFIGGSLIGWGIIGGIVAVISYLKSIKTVSNVYNSIHDSIKRYGDGYEILQNPMNI